MLKMLDTNICSYLIRGLSPWSESTLDLDDTFVLSTIVVYELEQWALKDDTSPDMQNLIRDFYASMRVLPFGVDAASQAAKVKRQLDVAAKNIGAIDPLIAGHALSVDAVLISNNVKDFSQVQGLKLANSFN